jgi:hypothetical protein
MPPKGLVTALNKMREMSVQEGSVYHQYVPYITEDTSISEFARPLTDDNLEVVRNEFFGLLKRIVFTSIQTQIFNNPLNFLEGDELPLGYAGENIHIDPAKPRQFNQEDFAGLLQKYEARIAVEYLSVNSDLQYPVTVTRDKARDAFVSWATLEEFISGIINSLFNGAYITRWNQAKALVAGAYQQGAVTVETVTLPTNEATAKAFVKKARYLNRMFQMPSTSYSGWNKKYANDDTKLKITTWSNSADIAVIIRADVESEIDVETLAKAFNMDKTDFIGRVVVVDTFDQFADDGTKIFDGSKILGIICDRRWFKIRTQYFNMTEFFNANNLSYQYYLNDTRMCRFSLFANACVLATGDPDSITLSGTTTVAVDGTTTLTATTVPAGATVVWDSSDETIATVANGVVTGVKAGKATITARNGNAVASVEVTVTAE